jgi:hypothetical protein
MLSTHVHLQPRLRMSRVIPPLPLCLHGVDRGTFTLISMLVYQPIKYKNYLYEFCVALVVVCSTRQYVRAISRKYFRLFRLHLWQQVHVNTSKKVNINTSYSLHSPFSWGTSNFWFVGRMSSSDLFYESPRKHMFTVISCYWVSERNVAYGMSISPYFARLFHKKEFIQSAAHFFCVISMLTTASECFLSCCPLFYELRLCTRRCPPRKNIGRCVFARCMFSFRVLFHSYDIPLCTLSAWTFWWSNEWITVLHSPPRLRLVVSHAISARHHQIPAELYVLKPCFVACNNMLLKGAYCPYL